MGYTLVHSTWTDEKRAEAEALIEAESMVCPQCGLLREVCSDPNQTWYEGRHICYATRARLGADRRFDLKHDDAPFQTWNGKGASSKKPNEVTPFHVRDGLRLWASPQDPDALT